MCTAEAGPELEIPAASACEELTQALAAFNRITRIADALEFEVPSWQQFLRQGKMLRRRGSVIPYRR